MRRLVLDIEVLQEGTKFPDPKEAERPVIAITLYDSYWNKYVTLVQREDLKEDVEVKEDDWRVVYTNSEERLFSLFLELFKAFDPDLIGGWNVFFDLAYIIRRAQVMNYFDPRVLSPLGRVEVDWNERQVKIAGRHVFDFLSGYRRIKRQPSYALKYVAEVEGVARKTEEAKDIPELYASDLERLIIYNKTDVQIVNELEDVVGILRQADDVRRFAGVSDINDTAYNSITLDTFSLRVAKHFNIVLPNKAHGEKVDYEGAIVFNPVAGLHKWVVTLDMKRYYPSIILTCNLSPETLNNPDKEGLAPKIVKLLLNLRKKIEEDLEKAQPGTPEYDLLQRKKLVAKQIVNGFYGYYAYKRSRFYSPEIAARITATARQGLLVVKRTVESKGFSVVYGDTDSVFVKLPDDLDLDEVVAVAEGLQSDINKELEKFAREELHARENYLEIEFEKVFNPLLLFADKKKRYAGRIVFEKGKKADYTKIVGFDTIRTDTPQAFRKVQADLFDMILRGAPRENIKTYLQDIIKKVKNGEFSPSELGIPQGINKPLLAYAVGKGKATPQHIRAAIWSNKHLGTRFDKGDKVKILFVRKVEGYPNTDVLAFTDDMVHKLPPVVIDTQRYIQWLRSKSEEILKVVGISWHEVEGGKTLWELMK